MTDDYRVVNADCMDAMGELGDGSVDAIVTDPPYGLAFMGARWDSFGGGSGETIDERRRKMNAYLGADAVVPAFASSHGKRVTHGEMVSFQESMTPVFREALRVAKPGAHLLCFGGTRTFHRMACAIEDAGWEIRDTIMWVYGSGFPKGMDVGKAIDKALGAQREKGAKKVYAGGHVQNSHESIGYGGSDPKADDRASTEPATELARQWDGWNTQLKPAWEPIIVARKPLDGTVAHNVMEHGTGAINIDGCRVPTNDKLGGGLRANGAEGVWDRPFMHDEDAQEKFMERKRTNIAKAEELGRYPANLVHDGSDEVLELFPTVAKSAKCRQARTPKKTDVYGLYSMEKKDSPMVGYTDGGSAARFFYCAKASKRDRGEGNNHPTVKPTALMQWLVRLVCPRGGLVLDPFCGSGSTGVACAREGMRFLGIDSDKHYCEIAEGRIEGERG